MATTKGSRSIVPVVVEVQVTVKALAFPEPDGGDSVVVPEVPGCVTQGEDIDEVRAMAAELAEALLDMAHEREKDRAIRDLFCPLPSEATP